MWLVSFDFSEWALPVFITIWVGDMTGTISLSSALAVITVPITRVSETSRRYLLLCPTLCLYYVAERTGARRFYNMHRRAVGLLMWCTSRAAEMHDYSALSYYLASRWVICCWCVWTFDTEKRGQLEATWFCFRTLLSYIMAKDHATDGSHVFSWSRMDEDAENYAGP